MATKTNLPRIAAISGSLRSGSYNTAALRALQMLASDRLDIDIITLHGIELFDEDVEAQGWPPEVQKLRERVASSVGILFATPEYNYSIPGVLKNAIDWLSRPTHEGPICFKPATIIGASASVVGTARAQAHLRQVAYYNGMPLLQTEEILIASAGEKFDSDGSLKDDETREHLSNLAGKFADWLDQQ